MKRHSRGWNESFGMGAKPCQGNRMNNKVSLGSAAWQHVLFNSSHLAEFGQDRTSVMHVVFEDVRHSWRCAKVNWRQRAQKNNNKSVLMNMDNMEQNSTSSWENERK